MVEVVRRNKTESMRERENLSRNIDLRQYAVKCRLKAPYISHARWRAPCGFSQMGFHVNFPMCWWLNVYGCLCFYLFMIMMQVLSWLNECLTVNKILNEWIGYYALLLSVSLCLRCKCCCASVMLHLYASLILYSIMFKVLRPNLCHVVISQ